MHRVSDPDVAGGGVGGGQLDAVGTLREVSEGGMATIG